MLSVRGLKSHGTISLPLDIPDVTVIDMRMEDNGDYFITVESMRDSATCQHCGRVSTKFHGHGREIELRHLPILGHRVYIRLRPKRYACLHCDGKTTTQTLDWYEAKSPHTNSYNQHLMLQLVNSTTEDVSQKENVGYDAVEGTIERYICDTVNWEEFDELNTIGLDEIAMRRGRKDFVAIITTQQADGQVKLLAVLPDRKKKTVRAFLETIPKRLRKTMKTACTDMWKGYVNAVEEFSTAHPEVSIQVVIDRFHVAKNYREAVDKVRKQECRRLKEELSETEYENIKGMMWIVRKNNADLTSDEQQKLCRLLELSPKLTLAYTFREELTAIFEMDLTKKEAKERLTKWRDKVEGSSTACFKKFLTTLNNWLDRIINYFTDRLSSGFVEGLNNKIKTIKRRCYGVLRVTTLFQRIYLDLDGYRRFT